MLNAHQHQNIFVQNMWQYSAKPPCIQLWHENSTCKCQINLYCISYLWGAGTAYFQHICILTVNLCGRASLCSAERGDLAVPRTAMDLFKWSFSVAARSHGTVFLLTRAPVLSWIENPRLPAGAQPLRTLFKSVSNWTELSCTWWYQFSLPWKSNIKEAMHVPSFQSLLLNTKARPLAGVNALTFLQCFITVGWLTGRESSQSKQCHFSPKGVFEKN